MTKNEMKEKPSIASETYRRFREEMPPLEVNDTTDAAELYCRYASGRKMMKNRKQQNINAILEEVSVNTKKQAAIDRIVSNLDSSVRVSAEAPLTTEQLTTEQLNTVQLNTVQQPYRSTRTATQQLFELPGRILSFIADSLFANTARTAATAIAATGIFAIALFMAQPEQSTQSDWTSVVKVPATLLQGDVPPGVMAQFIGTDSVMGMSASENSNGNYYRLGTLVTQLVISLSTDEKQLVDTVNDHLIQQGAYISEETLQESINTLAVSTAHGLQSEALTSALRQLQSDVSSNQNDQWYSTGQIVEALRYSLLARSAQMDDPIDSSLQDVIAAFNRLDIGHIQSLPNLNPTLVKMREITNSNAPLSTVQRRDLLQLIKQIELLLQ